MPPLPEDDGKETAVNATPSSGKAKKESAEKQAQNLSFGSIGSKAKSHKRKAVGDGRDDEPPSEKSTKVTKKKPKKAEKKLLSFGEES